MLGNPASQVLERFRPHNKVGQRAVQLAVHRNLVPGAARDAND